VQLEYIQRVRAEYPGLPCFIYGHSTGGAVALKVNSSLLYSDKILHSLLCDVYGNDDEVDLLFNVEYNPSCLLLD
jgi:thioesterase domain-containing protein